MLQNERDTPETDYPEKKICFGDKVDTPDGVGQVTELDGNSALRYYVIFQDGTGSWYEDEELVVVR